MNKFQLKSLTNDLFLLVLLYRLNHKFVSSECFNNITFWIWDMIFYGNRKIWARSDRPSEPNSPGRVLQATNTSINIKEPFSSSLYSPIPSPNTPPFLPHTKRKIDCYHLKRGPHGKIYLKNKIRKFRLHFSRDRRD